MIAIFLALVATLYVLQMIILRIGLERSDRARRLNGYEPTVSIVVAARNEEHCIQACIDSLLALDYPAEKLELMIVNDGSSDRTKEIAEFSSRNAGHLRVITAIPGTGNLLGKANAVAQGIDASRGEILMFTDADCTVQEGWVKETVRYFDAHVGVVGGFTLLHASSQFEGMQALDWIFLFGLASGTSGLGLPLTVIGNNLSVRRSAYDATGGYEKIPFSVTEDYALVQSIISKSEYSVAFPMNPDTVVRSGACPDAKGLFRQKQRWAVGGLDMVWQGIMMTAIGGILRVLLILSCFSLPFPIIAAAAGSMMFMDIRFLWRPLRKFGALRYLWFFPVFELYYLVYVPLIPLVASFSRNIVWKKRTL